jgi:hypothetical protein
MGISSKANGPHLENFRVSIFIKMNKRSRGHFIGSETFLTRNVCSLKGDALRGLINSAMKGKKSLRRYAYAGHESVR